MTQNKNITDFLHKINNSNHKIMLNVPIIKAAWNDLNSKFCENSGFLDNFTVAGLPYEEALSVIAELFESIENSSFEIKNTVAEFRNSHHKI